MAETITPISRAISDVLTGAYNKRRLTQEVVAKRANMSIWTLQKKLKARAPITATDLVVLARAIGVSPTDVLDEALSDIQKAGVSEAPTNLSDYRKKEPSTMTEEELLEEPHAAGQDPELEADESGPA